MATENRMDRRNFLAGLGAVVGGLAIAEAIPLGRVWSFPSKLVLQQHEINPPEMFLPPVGDCIVATGGGGATLRRGDKIFFLSDPRSTVYVIDELPSGKLLARPWVKGEESKQYLGTIPGKGFILA